jgi:carboxymethylenebutenolidase
LYTTDQYEGMIAETVAIRGYNGDIINTYYARPLGPGPFPGMVLLHHFPGWDEWYREATRKFAHHGYLAIAPNLYQRLGHGTPEDMAVQARAAGGPPDDDVVGDTSACREFLKAQANSNGKVGVMGTCSGGRHAYLCACRAPGFDAVADLWGGGVVAPPEQATPSRPVAPIEYTRDLSCPLIGIFGDDDRQPSPEQVNLQEEELKKHGKEYEFHRYAGAGHGFFYYDRPAYRQEQAVDGWQQMLAFFDKHLG